MAHPATYENTAVRCRNTEQFGDGSPALRLQTNRPKVWFAATLPGMPMASLKEIFFRGVNKWSLVANVKAVEAANQAEADWIIVPSRIDGKNGVLADMMMPGPRPQYMRLDVAENASEDQLEQTCMHEGGHGYGLFHTPAGPPAEVMDPSLNMSVRTPQAAEAKLMESMYGAPMQPKPTPQPDPIPTPSSIKGEIRVTLNGETWVASGPLKKQPQAIHTNAYPTGPIINYQPEDFDLPDTELLGDGE
jgi:hypothetical protein